MLMSMPKILPPKPFPAVAELKVVAASMLLIFNFDWALAERPKNKSKAHIDPVKVVFFHFSDFFVLSILNGSEGIKLLKD